MNPVLYATLCVLVPAAWGLIMYHAFGWIDRRRRSETTGRAVSQPDFPPIDYYI